MSRGWTIAQLVAVGLGAVLVAVLGLGVAWQPATDVLGQQAHATWTALHGQLGLAAVLLPLPFFVWQPLVSRTPQARKGSAATVAVALTAYVVGAVMVVADPTYSMSDGWTFYTPYTTPGDGVVGPGRLGILVLLVALGIRATLTVVQLLRRDAEGRLVIATPLGVGLGVGAVAAVAAGGSALITILTGAGKFEPTMGGDPLLFDREFWPLTAPAMWFVVLPPAVGLVVEVFARVARRVAGARPAAMVDAVALAVAMLAGLVAALSLNTQADIHLHDTVFAVATQHALTAGVPLFGTLAAVHLVRGRVTAIWASIGVAAAFAGWLAVGVSLGTAGMPRRYATYVDGYDTQTMVSAILATAVVVLLVVALIDAVSDRRPED